MDAFVTSSLPSLHWRHCKWQGPFAPRTLLRFLSSFYTGSRHTTWTCDWSSDVCSSDLHGPQGTARAAARVRRRPGRQPVAGDRKSDVQGKIGRPGRRPLTENVKVDSQVKVEDLRLPLVYCLSN